MIKHKQEEYIGKTFGQLTINNFAGYREGHGKNHRKYLIVNCSCSCGKQNHIARFDDVKANHQKSCGCLKIKKPLFNNLNLIKPEYYLSFIGKKYGKLTLLEYEGRKGKSNHPYFKCQCECKQIKSLNFYNLSSGTKSCGCLMDKARKDKKKPFGEVPLNLLYIQYRGNAKEKGCDFLLTKKEFSQLVFQKCFYCGDEPSSKIINRRIPEDFILYNGIDRKNNEMGYVFENCVTSCSFCNFSKRNNTQEYFLNKVKKIYQKHYGIAS